MVEEIMEKIISVCGLIVIVGFITLLIHSVLYDNGKKQGEYKVLSPDKEYQIRVQVLPRNPHEIDKKVDQTFEMENGEFVTFSRKNGDIIRVECNIVEDKK